MANTVKAPQVEIDSATAKIIKTYKDCRQQAEALKERLAELEARIVGEARSAFVSANSNVENVSEAVKSVELVNKKGERQCLVTFSMSTTAPLSGGYSAFKKQAALSPNYDLKECVQQRRELTLLDSSAATEKTLKAALGDELFKQLFKVEVAADLTDTFVLGYLIRGRFTQFAKHFGIKFKKATIKE